MKRTDLIRQLTEAGCVLARHGARHDTDVFAPWQDFFTRALAPDRARRPSSAAEFLRQLEEALA